MKWGILTLQPLSKRYERKEDAGKMGTATPGFCNISVT
ncbi:hypothetical protein [Azospirillum largimobile]